MENLRLQIMVSKKRNTNAFLANVRRSAFHLACKVDDIAHDTNDIELFASLRRCMDFWQCSSFDDILNFPFNDDNILAMCEDIKERFKHYA